MNCHKLEFANLKIISNQAATLSSTDKFVQLTGFENYFARLKEFHTPLA